MIQGSLDRLLIFFSIQKFLIFPEIRFLISIHSRMIFILFKLWYLFHIVRAIRLFLSKKIRHFYILLFSLIYLNFKQFIIKFKLRINRERYKSKCPRFILRQNNFRFAIFRYSYRKYYNMKHYITKQLPYIISYHYYINFYKYVDLTYAFIMMFYIMILFTAAVFAGFMFIVLGHNASDKYFYNLNAWINI